MACMDLVPANHDQCIFRGLSPLTILDYTPWISLGQQPHSSSRIRICVAEPWTPYNNACYLGRLSRYRMCIRLPGGSL